MPFEPKLGCMSLVFAFVNASAHRVCHGCPMGSPKFQPDWARIGTMNLWELR